MKPLSQLLAEVEPKFHGMFAIDIPAVDRASYDKLKAIAVELAKALEFYSKHHHHLNTTAPNFANESITTAREMLGEYP